MEIIWLNPLLNWAEYFGWIYVSCLCVHSLCSGNWRQGHSSSTCKLQGSECFQCGSSERLSLPMSCDRFDTCKPPHLHPPQRARHTLSDVACDWNHILQENCKPCDLIFPLASVHLWNQDSCATGHLHWHLRQSHMRTVAYLKKYYMRLIFKKVILQRFQWNMYL